MNGCSRQTHTQTQAHCHVYLQGESTGHSDAGCTAYSPLTSPLPLFHLQTQPSINSRRRKAFKNNTKLQGEKDKKGWRKHLNFRGGRTHAPYNNSPTRDPSLLSSTRQFDQNILQLQKPCHYSEIHYEWKRQHRAEPLSLTAAGRGLLSWSDAGSLSGLLAAFLAGADGIKCQLLQLCLRVFSCCLFVLPVEKQRDSWWDQCVCLVWSKT